MNASLEGYHLYGLSWTLTCTESARLFVLDGNAEFASPDCVPDLDGSPLFYGDGLYCRSRTNLRATVAFWPTIALFEAYFGLHKAVETAAGTQYIVRTSVDAELASRTMTAEIAYRERTWRCDEFLSTRFLLLDDVSQTAICRLWLDLCLSLSDGCSCKESDACQYGSTGSICSLPRPLRRRGEPMRPSALAFGEGWGEA